MDFMGRFGVGRNGNMRDYVQGMEVENIGRDDQYLGYFESQVEI